MYTPTKSEVLENLREKIQSAIILPQYTIGQFDWIEDSEKCLRDFSSLHWSKNSLIVRSSHIREDCEEMSLAGHFTSLLNIQGDQELINAIDCVMKGYKIPSPNNSVFVQPMAKDILLSGVAFTRIPPLGAPYYLINYDDKTGRTDTVTSGESNCLKTFYFHRSNELIENSFWYKLFLLLKELETIFENEALDIEFAIKKDQSVILFQVRPLAMQTKTFIDPDLSPLVQLLQTKNNENSQLLGDRRIFGIMPDWNTAELLGIRPNPLALSLFQETIAETIWAESRFQYGYRDVRNIPLLQIFEGQPFVDILASFNSLTPRDLESSLSEKLINFYLSVLREKPHLHDKVEFEIVLSCFTFDMERKLDRLEEQIPTLSSRERNQLGQSLKTITNQITHNEYGLCKLSLQQLTVLEEKFREVESSSIDEREKIHLLLKDVKTFGTLPFAGIARSAFIATQMLQSLIKIHVIDETTYFAYLQSIKSISSQLNDDLCRLSKIDFLKKYGHLRPGTFDILSQRYDEAPDLYFDFSNREKQKTAKKKDFCLTALQKKQINKLLQEQKIQHTAETLFSFFSDAIRGRELAKFMFTKSVSCILKLVETYGQKHGFSREKCAFLTISDIINPQFCNSQDLREVIEKREKNDILSKHLHLPPLIFEESDLMSFHLFEEKPNYITLERTCAPTADIQNENIMKKIVFIPSADPGYDWIFSKEIAGFITCYGGCNSHMAIRAAELNLPAVIGAGQLLFTHWKHHTTLEIDCANRKVTPIK